jgi:hypothetical protein
VELMQLYQISYQQKEQQTEQHQTLVADEPQRASKKRKDNASHNDVKKMNKKIKKDKKKVRTECGDQ